MEEQETTIDYLAAAARQEIPREEAYSLCRRDAERGDPVAQSNLALMYSKGFGVKKNHKTAFKWCKLSAEQGNPVAQCNLGAKYHHGEGIQKNHIRAHMWLNIASINGQRGAEKLQDIVSKRMTHSQVVEARELAKECIKNKYRGF